MSNHVSFFSLPSQLTKFLHYLAKQKNKKLHLSHHHHYHSTAIFHMTDQLNELSIYVQLDTT